MAEPGNTGRRVAIAIDDSDFAEQAFNFYMENLRRPDDYLILVHCPEMYNFVDASPSVIQQLLDEIKAKVRKLEDKYQKLMADKGVTHGLIKVAEGKPGEIIVKAAKENNCDLIVTGCRGLGKIRRTFLGSVSDYVIHHSHCPVLVHKH